MYIYKYFHIQNEGQVEGWKQVKAYNKPSLYICQFIITYTHLSS